MEQPDLTKIWRRSSPTGLLRIAKDIESQGSWRGYLTVAEHEVFKRALESGGDQWSKLLEGKAHAKVEIISPPTNGTNSGSPRRTPSGPGSTPFDSSMGTAHTPRTPTLKATPLPSLVELDPVSLAFRVRYMLYEKAIGVVYASRDDSQEVDFSLLEDESHQQSNQSNGTGAQEKPAARKTDEDYDFDEDEDEEEEEEKGKDENTNGGGSNEIKEESQEGDDICIKVNVTPEDEAQMVKQASDNYNKLYHTFEGDWENALKQRKLEESDRQVDIDVDSKMAASQPAAGQYGAANLSLKHLLAMVESKRDQLQLGDIELRNLISDVRKNRSKWASEDKIGQEELYEAAEKVVLELRGYTEHSTAFLNKVNKRDAPNYFNVIKNPMDLNTVMKKLKSFQYKSKKEFVSDLMLIWRNCLTYNADPKHFLRAHAFAMQNKTLSLIPLIPDIEVRDRAEVEAEEAAAAAAANGSQDDQVGRTSRKGPGKGPGKHTTKGKKRKLEDTEDGPTADNAEEAEQDVKMSEPEDSRGSQPPPPSGTRSPVPASVRESTPRYGTPGDSELQNAEEEAAAASDNDESNLDAETMAWRKTFTQQRSIYACARGNIYKDNKLQMDAPAPLRTQLKMSKYEEALNSLSNGGEDNKHKPFFARGILESLNDNDKSYLMEYDVGSGVPPVPWALDPKNTDDGMGHLNIDDIKPSAFLCQGGLTNKMNDNLKEMQEIRRICSKISLIRQMKQQAYVHNPNTSTYHPEEINDTDLDIESRLPDRDPYNSEVAFAAMKRATAKVSMHAGFEVTESMASEALTEIACDYMTKLGSTLKLMMESDPRSNSSFEDLIVSSLEQNGIESISSLDLYIRNDIEVYGNRLHELCRKLTAFLKDLLRPAAELSETQFNDNSEQFLNGDFSAELGDEDFFGFRELGLDKELGLLSSSVPLHLLQARIQAGANMQSSLVSQDTEREPTVPEYPGIDRHGAQKQVGLLRPYFVAKFDTGHAEILPEGDQLPPKQRNTRPKLPPTGKIGGVKKKPVSKAYFIKEAEPEPEPAPAADQENKDSAHDDIDNDLAMKLEMEIENANKEDSLF
uniref:SAGA complex subunit Spt7 n=1 Tax=Blastobotrys adeninivorans TaxID=409370 RepID=A0A060T7R8_BLAAD